MLKFKVDENLPREAPQILTDGGYDAVSVPDQQMGGRPDPDVVAVCQAEERVLITLDMDFSDIRAYPPSLHPGMVVLRLSRVDKRRVLDAIGRLVPLLEKEPLIGKLWIVDETRVRMRD